MSVLRLSCFLDPADELVLSRKKKKKKKNVLVAAHAIDFEPGWSYDL